MSKRRGLLTGASFVVVLAVLAVAEQHSERLAAAQAKAAVQAPRF